MAVALSVRITTKFRTYTFCVRIHLRRLLGRRYKRANRPMHLVTNPSRSSHAPRLRDDVGRGPCSYRLSAVGYRLSRCSARCAIAARSLQRAVAPPISRSVSGRIRPTFSGRLRADEWASVGALIGLVAFHDHQAPLRWRAGYFGWLSSLSWPSGRRPRHGGRSRLVLNGPDHSSGER